MTEARSHAGRGRRDRGAVIPLIALVLPVLIMATAFAVDLGRQRALRRDLQADADVIALDLVRLADGREEGDIKADPGYLDYVNASFTRNSRDPADSVQQLDDLDLVEWGTWTEGGGFVQTLDYATPPNPPNPPNAVRVRFQDTIDYYFQPGTGGADRAAVAHQSELVDLHIGSVALGLQPRIPGADAEVQAFVRALNAELAARLGANIPPSNVPASFDLVGYQGLAAADVELGRMAAAAGFGSADELLDSTITVGQFFNAAATALDSQAADGDPNAAFAAAQFRRVSTQFGVNQSATMQLGSVFTGSTGDGSAATTTVNALDLLTGGAQAINGTNLLNVEFTSPIPGVGLTNVKMATIEKEQHRLNARPGDSAQTAQVRFQLDLEIGPTFIPGLTSNFKIPLIVEGARGVATSVENRCATPEVDSESDVEVDTDVLRVTIGTTGSLANSTMVIDEAVSLQQGPLSLTLKLHLLLGTLFNLTGNVTSSGTVTVGGGTSMHTFFPLADPNPYQRAMGGAGFSVGTALSAALQTSFPNLADGVLRTDVAAAFDQLDELVVNPLLHAAGISLGGADVLADNLRCEALKLVE